MKCLAILGILSAMAGCQAPYSIHPNVNPPDYEIRAPVEHPAVKLTDAERAYIVERAPEWIERRTRTTVRFLEEPHIWCERIGDTDRATLYGPVAAYTVFGSWVKRDVTLHVERRPWGFDLPNESAVSLFP